MTLVLGERVQEMSPEVGRTGKAVANPWTTRDVTNTKGRVSILFLKREVYKD